MNAITRILLSFSISAVSLAAQEAADSKSAESVATQYMTAFFHGELETAAAFLGPSIVNALKSMLQQQIEKAAPEERNAFLQQLGYASLEAFREAPPKELFVRMTRLDRNASPTFTERAKSAIVTLEKSERIDTERCRVTLRVRMPHVADQLPTVVVHLIDEKWVISGM